TRPHRFFEVTVLRARVRNTELARKIVEDRERHRQARLERLPGELEREDGIPVAQRLLVGRAPDEAAAIVRRQTRVRADRVVVLALRVLARERRLLTKDDRVDISELLREARSSRRERQCWPVAGRRGAHVPRSRAFPRAQGLERGILLLSHRQQI